MKVGIMRMMVMREEGGGGLERKRTVAPPGCKRREWSFPFCLPRSPSLPPPSHHRWFSGATFPASQSKPAILRAWLASARERGRASESPGELVHNCRKEAKSQSQSPSLSKLHVTLSAGSKNCNRITSPAYLSLAARRGAGGGAERRGGFSACVYFEANHKAGNHRQAPRHIRT